MKPAPLLSLGGAASALMLAGCAPAPRPEVRQLAALTGQRTVAIAPAPPESDTSVGPDRTAVEQALARAGFVVKKSMADARYLLLLTVAAGPRRVGSLLPPDEGAAAGPVRWVARPPRGLAGTLGPPAGLRIGAVVVDGATGRELWRGTLSTPRNRRPDQVTSLAIRLLGELPGARAAGGS